jgi:hypothetical protein
MVWLTAMEYLCHKCSRICSTCRKHFPVLSSFMAYHRFCYYINTTGATREATSADPSRAAETPPVFSEVRVTQSLDFCVCFVDCCLSFCLFSFGHCVVYSSSIYRFCLPLWYLQSLRRLVDFKIYIPFHTVSLSCVATIYIYIFL